MDQHSHRAALERIESDSIFPPEEAGSICTRPTPLVPASDELRTLGTRSHPPEHGRTTLRPSARPTASFGLASELALLGPVDPLPDLAPNRELAPVLDVASFPPPLRVAPRRSRARAIVSKLLFATLFAGVATLFGLALKKKLDTSGHADDVANVLAPTR
ncbi:MAG TPA: hypothetical protein VFZ53_15315 [Polyangiaceae bacterium]